MTHGTRRNRWVFVAVIAVAASVAGFVGLIVVGLAFMATFAPLSSPRCQPIP